MAEPRPPASSEARRGSSPPVVWVQPLLATFGWAVALLLLLYFFREVKEIILGLLAASAVAALLKPAVAWMPGPRRIRAPLVWAIFTLLCVGFLFLTSWLVSKPIRQQLQSWPQVEQDINAMLQRVGDRIGMLEPPTVGTLFDQALAFVGGSAGAQIISQTTTITADILIAVAFLFVGSLYLLITPLGELVSPIVGMVPPRRRNALCGVFEDIEPRLRWWSIGALLSIVIVGLLSWIGYALASLRFAVPMALLMGVSELIPTVGPLAVFIVTLILALAQGPAQVVGVSIVYSIIHVFEAYLLHPIVMRQAVRIPPVVTLFTVVLWGKVLGIAGLLLAIPIDLVIWTVADRFLLQPEKPCSMLPTDAPASQETQKTPGQMPDQTGSADQTPDS